MIVAEITKDYITNDPRDISPSEGQVGRQFDYEAMCNWWGWGGLPDVDGWIPQEKTSFKVYDDDGELYYEGWLKNDDECIIQQFVLRWAESFAGCTQIEVNRKTVGWTQEIG